MGRKLPQRRNGVERAEAGDDEAAAAEGVLTYPTQGCVDGHRGDHILLAPPFTISEEECALVGNALATGLAKVFPS